MTMPSTEPLPARQAEYLTLGAEARGLEFKQSLEWADTDARLRLVRTLMAMSNNPGGGVVVVGVRENDDGTYSREGMSRDHYDSLDPDALAAETARYADPAVEMRTAKGLHDQRLFGVIEIEPSTEVPTVCKQAHGGGSGILREGAIYVRPAGTPRTEEIHTYRDMRAIIDQAVERRIERFRELGLLPAAGSGPISGDREAHDSEIKDLL